MKIHTLPIKKGKDNEQYRTQKCGLVPLWWHIWIMAMTIQLTHWVSTNFTVLIICMFLNSKVFSVRNDTKFLGILWCFTWTDSRPTVRSVDVRIQPIWIPQYQSTRSITRCVNECTVHIHGCLWASNCSPGVAIVVVLIGDPQWWLNCLISMKCNDCCRYHGFLRQTKVPTCRPMKGGWNGICVVTLQIGSASSIFSNTFAVATASVWSSMLWCELLHITSVS